MKNPTKFPNSDVAVNIQCTGGDVCVWCSVSQKGDLGVRGVGATLCGHPLALVRGCHLVVLQVCEEDGQIKRCDFVFELDRVASKPLSGLV